MWFEVETKAKILDYEKVKAKNGFAYYIMEKKGEIGFELNKKYRVHPQITSE